MVYNDYEEYMKEVLGYKGIHNQCFACGGGNCYNTMQMAQYQGRERAYNNIEQMYPKIYKTINPIVCQMCAENTLPITEDLISNMTDKIYNTVITRIEADNIININVSTSNTSSNENSKTIKAKTNIENNRNPNNMAISQVHPQSKPEEHPRNSLLNDLIRILILNNLLNQNRGSQMSTRPAMVGMPGFIGDM